MSATTKYIFKNFIHGKKIGLVILSLLLLCFHYSAFAKIKEIGLPFISNYQRESYNASAQNWSITQDANGFMYFANNDGVLRYDGIGWELFPLPNASIVRVVLSSEGKIYAGGFDEFGYYSYNKSGELLYTSLSSRLDSVDKSFGEIWRIYSTRYGVVFQSYYALFLLQGDKLVQIQPESEFGFSYFVDNHLFVIDREVGLSVLQGKKLAPMISDSVFFKENEITFIFSSESKEYLLGTTNNGIYVYDGEKIKPWNKKINERFIVNQTYTAIEISEEVIAIGTIQDGIYIISTEGEILQHINRLKGLQNNTVLSVFFDKDNNLWLGLDNGIDHLEVSSPISIINHCFNIEATYSSIVHNGVLYVGTNQGLFAKNFKSLSNHSLMEDGFRLVPGTQGQVWKLREINGVLWCGHNLGIFIIDGFTAKQISKIQGGWDFVAVPGQENFVIGGTYSGLVLFEYDYAGTKKWHFVKEISGFDESSRELDFDQYGNVWMTHTYKGLFRIDLSADLSAVTSFSIFNKAHGLPPLPYTLARVHDELFIVSKAGLFSFNTSEQSFEQSDYLEKIIGKHSNVVRVKEDSFGDIWCFTEREVFVYRLQEDGAYTQIKIPFYRIRTQFLADSYENVYAFNEQNFFIGGQKGMLHYNPDNKKRFVSDYRTFLRTITVNHRDEDSVIHKLYGLSEVTSSNSVNTLSFKYNSIAFEYFAPFYEDSRNTKFSFKLSGFDTRWSEWDSRSVKEYTNLKEGKYIFEVKARNIYKNESGIARYEFIVLPPWYRTNVFYAFYIVLVLGLGVLAIFYFRKKVEKARRIEKIKHEKVLISKEIQFQEEVKLSENEIEKLKSEKLKSDMRHKNMELANATMHLIQKNKFLTKLKGDLNRMWGEAQVDSVKSDLKSIVKKIDKDFKNEQHWKVFDKYFEEVHQDFILRLKEKHPILTPNDLRLCAYLKMNLSTKEIAPLLNISVRGLEISRYRLRKKLDLNRNVNLTDYILEI
jgi:ligand-binding sensor domain-containing protein/DNA-binding CsgD family transcriptional regulator